MSKILVGHMYSPYRYTIVLKEDAILSWCYYLVSKPIKCHINTFYLCIRPYTKNHRNYTQTPMYSNYLSRAQSLVMKMRCQHRKGEISIKYLNDPLDTCWRNAYNSIRQIFNVDPGPSISSLKMYANFNLFIFLGIKFI